MLIIEVGKWILFDLGTIVLLVPILCWLFAEWICAIDDANSEAGK